MHERSTDQTNEPKKENAFFFSISRVVGLRCLEIWFRFDSIPTSLSALRISANRNVDKPSRRWILVMCVATPRQRSLSTLHRVRCNRSHCVAVGSASITFRTRAIYQHSRGAKMFFFNCVFHSFIGETSINRAEPLFSVYFGNANSLRRKFLAIYYFRCGARPHRN